MKSEFDIIFDWEVSSFFGWGLYGLNLMLHWPGDALSALPPGDICLTGEEERRRVARLFGTSAQLHRELQRHAGATADISMPVLRTLGNNLARARGIHDIDLHGKPTVGVVFLEDSVIEEQRARAADLFQLIIAGSEWAEGVLRRAGIEHVATVVQGVDCELFQPRPPTGWLADRFKVFSGGKLEFRKAQDLVLLAFRTFANRHPDAVLVTAWHSPFPNLSRDFAASGIGMPPPAEDGFPNALAWAHTAGIQPHQIIDLGPMPNCEMPQVLRDMDAAIFANRCEGGTNLVAMECLASGIPTILSANTGHLDLIARVPCYVLRKQTVVTAEVSGIRGTEGWGESDVEEIVEHLELIYLQHRTARDMARRSAEAIRELTWRNQIEALHRALLPLVEQSLARRGH